MCFFTKSYWDFFFPSFNYHSDHVATCFIVESCTLFPAALLRACLPLEGLLIPGWSLQAVSDSSSSGWSSWGSLSYFRNWLTRKLFLSQCSNPGEVGLQTCCPGSDGAVMGQWWGHVSATHLMLWVGHQPCCSMLCQGQLSWATHHMLFWKSKPQLVSCLVQLKWVLISAEHLDWDQPGLFTTCRKKKRLFLPNPKCISISKCGRNLWLFPKNISTLFVVLLQIAGNLAGANRGRNVTLGSSDFLLWVLHSQQNCQPTFKDVQVSWWPGSENKSHLGTPLTFAPSPEVVKSRLDGAFSNLF